MKYPRRFAAWLCAVTCTVSLFPTSAAGAERSTAERATPIRDQRFAGKTYVVTGASSGFGRGVAVELGRRGGNVVLAARRTLLLNQVAAEIQAVGGRALVVTTDVSRSNDIARLARAAVARFGRIDVWINNAGVEVLGRFWEVPDADYSQMIDTNYKGVVYGSKAAIRQFQAQGGYGVLVNVGSIDSEVPHAYQAAYSGTKAAVLNFSRTIKEELRLNGYRRIKVATVMPWATDTPFWPHGANYTGRTARNPAMDDPSKVVKVLLRATVHPKEEMPVGWKARGAYWFHRAAPDVAEGFTANLVHREIFKKGGMHPRTSGSVHRPVYARPSVEGGVRAQMKAEDRTQR